jgi:hypothetical protein
VGGRKEGGEGGEEGWLMFGKERDSNLWVHKFVTDKWMMETFVV